jgi:hypothetical protein
MISYSKNRKNINVYLGSKRVGTIRPVLNGYCYFVYLSDEHGEVFKTINEVKKSIEEK